MENLESKTNKCYKLQYSDFTPIFGLLEHGHRVRQSLKDIDVDDVLYRVIPRRAVLIFYNMGILTAAYTLLERAA